MKKVLLSLLLSLFVAVGFATETKNSSNSHPLEISEAHYVFYPNTRYALKYNIQSRLVNGIWYYAKWYTVYYSGYALALNYNTGVFNNIYTSQSYYFVWTIVGY